MPSSLQERVRRILPYALVLGLLPLAGDATNNIQCCNVASSYATSLFGGGNGDEDFFTVPAGSPNLVVLLSNSSSMLDFPNKLPFPALASTGDNWTALDDLACKALGLDAGCSYGPSTSYLNNQTGTVTTASATLPYDNGRASSTTVLVNDSPPWGYPAPNGAGTCTPLVWTGTGTCLFRRAAYYYYRTKSNTDLTGLVGSGGLGDPSASWSTASAHEIVSSLEACATIGGYGVPSAANCASALASKGYYLYRDQRVGGSNRPYAALLAGWFLNLYPPKFVMARKIVKSLAMLDTDRPGPVDNVRLGLAVLKSKTSGNGGQKNSLSNTDGGTLLVPLGPNCSVYPARVADMTAPRQAVVTALNDPTKVFFYDATNGEIMNQLAETLYDIGQYYTNYDATGNVYTKVFGNGWVNTSSNWLQSSAGTISASWAAAGMNQKSICWACQQSSVVIVTDGLPKYDNNLPAAGNIASHTALQTGGDGTGDFRNWSNGKIACPNCGVDAGNGVANLLHKLAYFLNQTDLRTETGMDKLQTVVTYTVSFGIIPGSPAETLLQKTAELGGGTFTNAADADGLMQALNDAALNITARATGFSVAATPTLQTSQNTQLLLARFRPNHSPAWEGHLYRFRVFNEFAEGCDSTRSDLAQIASSCTTKSGTTVSKWPNLNHDQVNGKAVCTGVYILDADCDTVVENDNGDFKKATFNSSGVLVAGSGDAVPYWDAGSVLSTSTATGYRSADESAANRRMIYTVIDSDGDGRYTSADRMVELKTTLAAADWTLLKASLGVDVSYCTTLFGKMGVLNSSASFNPTTGGATALDECAKQVVWFIRGFDVLDEDDDGCGGPDYPSNGTNCAAGTTAEERNRASDSRDTDYKTFWKLGDIFHSSPAIAKPPSPTLICDLALDPQCVATIHSPQALSGAVQTPMASYTVSGNTVDAYDKYRRDGAQRKRIALVGANDGMLHAFDAGSAITSTADAAGNYQFDEGTGAELWAFVPPDLLPKLKNALLDHTYFVDGDTMVRDVWVDGSGTATTKDGRKQADEFHTVAILSERAGGTQYVALDVTDPATPKFRWTYPQPCSLDASMVGQSWTGFAPRPPPIGPIKLAVTTNGPQDPLGRGFEERWIAMINGGYDASLTRGRGIWMMDAWNGATLWRFTNDEFTDQVNSNGGMWPVPGSVALLDIGVGNQAKIDSDGFFDSATWGDLGGQIYVARFASPDKTTWAAARAFEEQRQVDDGQTIANRSEFYLMPANTVDPATGYLHTYLGSGNRERLMVSGANCGPDNVFGCFQAGCNTDVTTTYDYGSCSYVVKAHANNGDIKQDRSTTNGTACTDAGITCSSVNVDFKVVTVCSGWKPVGGNFHASLTCDSSGVCSDIQKLQGGNGAPSNRLVDPQNHNRFYGVWSFGGAGRMFNSLTEAATFDANRFTDIAFTGPCAGPTSGACQLKNVTYATVDAQGAVTCSSGTTCSAGSYDPGWYYEYGRASACPLVSGCDATDWTDEKTASGAGILSSCVIWNSFRPVAGTGTTPCTNTSGTARNFAYLADFVSGVPTPSCGVGNAAVPTAYARATMTSGIAPPNQWASAVTRSKSGGTMFQQLSFPAGGAPQAQQVGVGSDTNQTIYWLEVPRALHACRHTDATQCD